MKVILTHDIYQMLFSFIYKKKATLSEQKNKIEHTIIVITIKQVFDNDNDKWDFLDTNPSYKTTHPNPTCLSKYLRIERKNNSTKEQITHEVN